MAAEVQHKVLQCKNLAQVVLTDALLSLGPFFFRGELIKQALINKIMLSQEITGSF